jgi:hypothetical protein
MAYTHCPTLSVEATCKKGLWKVDIKTPPLGWTRYSPDLVNIQCTKEGAHSAPLNWNYVGYDEKMSGMYCLYILYDEQRYEIGEVNIESNDRYSKVGNNWKTGDFLGEWECYEGREECKFKKI